jgi:hydroxyethylthiazole kinase-like uncharacterized protein yjeF
LDAISSREMNALEMNGEYFGVSRLQMMENAGHAIAMEVESRRTNEASTTLVFAGVGGNGGDGFAAARHLACLGRNVTVVLVGHPDQIHRDEVAKNWAAIQFMTDSVQTILAGDSTLIPPVDGDVILDALLGIGAQGPLRPPILHAVQRINELHGFKVAVDVPTGVNADTGAVLNDAVKADLTITFHRPKRGLLKATTYVGDLVVAPIGLPNEAETHVGPGDVSLVWTPRSPRAHKGDFGRLLVVGGSDTYSGAPALAALAALRVGVDIAYIASPRATAHDVASMLPSFITVKLEGEWLSPRNVPTVKRFLHRSTAVVLGPGLDLHEETVEAVTELITIIEDAKIPLLLDADGLKAFAKCRHQVDFPLVLMPHAGEYRILTGDDLPETIPEKVDHLKTTARNLGAVVLLKGPVDIITDGDRVKLNKYAHNPGMTVGGTGDVLSGIVGAFLSQGFDPFSAAAAGAFINGAAGDFVAYERGYHLLPTDVIEVIPKVIDDPMSHTKVRRTPFPPSRRIT